MPPGKGGFARQPRRSLLQAWGDVHRERGELECPEQRRRKSVQSLFSFSTTQRRMHPIDYGLHFGRPLPGAQLSTSLADDAARVREIMPPLATFPGHTPLPPRSTINTPQSKPAPFTQLHHTSRRLGSYPDHEIAGDYYQISC
ncbi:hypothetical protein CPSG_04135 [Coccidioides posadasii str. Silveira]|uniref:Uncharacterized protein n=1 Tax=Coccidioides posadasii (strain RMSCC 757 / Silveira) TaxID=443226 RepID=E9D1S7_COCPS|nr:hypothetical protein CPSG_04135 [Coccidioides posadasii str. Silveira]